MDFEINNGISTFNSQVVGVSGFLIFFLHIAGGGYSVGASTAFSAFSLGIFFNFVSSTLYGIAKPNMVSIIARDGPLILLTC